MKASSIKFLKTCFISNFPPRECGIATFTKDLSDAMDEKFNPKLKSKVVALNSEEDAFDYDDKVIMQMNKGDISHYIQIAKKINCDDDIKLVCIQHEFGIFGGNYGCYLIPFLEILQKPAVITFHTVLPNPDNLRKKLVREISSRVSAIIVTANAAIQILNEDYGIPKNKIFVIPHGIPNIPFQENKDKLKLKDKIVLSTFGMLSRGKGINFAIRSLPPLIKKYPNLVYLIIGKTHPGACYEDGDKYREELKDLVKKLNLEGHVEFIGEYLNMDEIKKYLLRTDVYIFTNLERAQISSGTLAYAMGCGKAIVSTPIIYAEELLAEDRGILVEFRNPGSFTNAIDKIISNPKLKKVLERNAYLFSRKMIWSNIAFNYLKIFNRVVRLREMITEKFPQIKLDHLKKITDNLGVIQFSKYDVPDKKTGYTLDDNARALIVSVLHNKLFNSADSCRLSKNYLRFIERAQDEEGNLKNQHKNKEEEMNPYSEDAFGRAIWALGATIDKSSNRELREKAKKIFNKSFDKIDELSSSRSIAFTIAGLAHYYNVYSDNGIFLKIKKLADQLVNLYNKEYSADWHWFEPSLTYSNAQISKALFLAYKIIKNKKYLNIAEKTLNFLSDLCIIENKLYPIGQNGWYNRSNNRAFFDQQPLDASAMVQTFLIAYEITKNKEYYNKAIIAFNWFLGHNHLDQMIYDEATGGCFDGLGKHSLNFNQGAESTICYLIARISLEEFKTSKKSLQPT